MCMSYATCKICLSCEVGHEYMNLNAACVTSMLLLHLVIHMQLTWPSECILFHMYAAVVPCHSHAADLAF